MSARPPGWEQRSLSGMRREEPRPSGSPPTSPATPPASLGPWLLGSCRGLTGTWLGKGQGHVVGEAGPDEAGSSPGHGGAGRQLGGELWRQACPRSGF